MAKSSTLPYIRSPVSKTSDSLSRPLYTDMSCSINVYIRCANPRKLARGTGHVMSTLQIGIISPEPATNRGWGHLQVVVLLSSTSPSSLLPRSIRVSFFSGSLPAPHLIDCLSHKCRSSQIVSFLAGITVCPLSSEDTLSYMTGNIWLLSGSYSRLCERALIALTFLAEKGISFHSSLFPLSASLLPISIPSPPYSPYSLPSTTDCNL